MKTRNLSLLRRLCRDERGQALILTVAMTVGFLGMCALTLDVGDLFYSYHQLQASTDAAALAGARYLPETAAVSEAELYSSDPTYNGKNQFSNIGTFSLVSVTPYCSSPLASAGDTCQDYGTSTTTTVNALKVVQQVKVPLFFARLFTSSPTLTLTATAKAEMANSGGGQDNVAIILDTTNSMGQTDSNCGMSRIACALNGVQTLLGSLSPCNPTTTGCSTWDTVSLFTFPNLANQTTNVSKDTTCPTSNPTIVPYNFPSDVPTTSGYSPSTGTGSTDGTYQVTSFLSNYRTNSSGSSSNSGTLNTSSALGIATGASTTRNCKGLATPGGDGTFIAGAIYAAQASLLKQQLSYSSSNNVLILLSDGQAASSQSQMDSGTNNNGTYPSYKQECTQYVQAGEKATQQGTYVYTVAYGAESSGCTDTNYTPCSAMAATASSAQYFYSDYNADGGDSGCVSTAHPEYSLSGIFGDIGSSLAQAKLVPNSVDTE